MNEQLISHIEELGLSNKEARVYVACLLTGAAAVQRIADQAGIKRVTTYVILESLVGLGLVSQSVKGKKTLFIAEEPTNLRRLLDKRAEELREQQSNFEMILPELSGLKSMPVDSPNVKYYDSIEGIQTILNSFIDRGRREDVVEAYGLSNIDRVNDFFPEIKTAKSNVRRREANIHSKFLYTSARGAILHDSDAASNRESRFVPFEKFPMTSDFTIVGDNVMLLTLNGKNPLGITITSSEIAASFRAIFDITWAAAEPFNK
jgi:sugar-specific transcriptional regulator TrmB